MDVRSELVITQSEAQARVPVTIIHPAGRINLSNSEQLERAVDISVFDDLQAALDAF